MQKLCDPLEATYFLHLELRWNETVENFWQSILLSQYPIRTTSVKCLRITHRLKRLSSKYKYAFSSFTSLQNTHEVWFSNCLFHTESFVWTIFWQSFRDTHNIDVFIGPLILLFWILMQDGYIICLSFDTRLFQKIIQVKIQNNFVIIILFTWCEQIVILYDL